MKDVSLPKSLVVLITEPIALFWLPTEVSGSVLINGETFVDGGLGSWIGFYDWLRTSHREVVGVRTWISGPEVEAIRRELSRNNAVDVCANDVRVWFAECRRFEESISDDQDLGTHRIMRNDAGELAFTFNVEGLSAEEIEALTGRAKQHG
jgi:hypothetical protein